MPTFANNSSVYFAMSTDALVHVSCIARQRERDGIDGVYHKKKIVIVFQDDTCMRSQNKRSVPTTLCTLEFFYNIWRICSTDIGTLLIDIIDVID